jgi:hypothetical protein
VASMAEADVVSERFPRFKDARCFEVVLEPGNALFIPPFWFHWFVHYPVFQLNLNVWWEPARHGLSPVSANWAYASALCKALGGFTEAMAAFEMLPPETQELLRRIEDHLLNDPSIMRPAEMLAGRAAVKAHLIPDPETGEYSP